MISASALIHPEVLLPQDVIVGPNAILEKGVVLSSGCVLGASCHLFPNVSLAKNVEVHQGAVIGGYPQISNFAKKDLKGVEIGEGSIVREYATINSGIQVKTSIGKNSLLMAYCHIGHDAKLEDNVILSNGVQIGGHVYIHEGAVIGGNTAIHQFSSIGSYSFVGGTLKIDRDIPPFAKAIGNPLAWAGLNKKGAERANISPVEFQQWKHLYNDVYRKKMPWQKALVKFSQLEKLQEWQQKSRNGILGAK